MGQTTDFLGHIDIVPALEPDEIHHLATQPVTKPVEGEPELLRGWVCCANGCCLTFAGATQDHPLEGLRRIVTLLRTQGLDHRLEGMVIGCRRDTGELFAIRAGAGRVTERTLHPGSDQPHEGERPSRRPRARQAAPTARVIDLTARRAQG